MLLLNEVGVALLKLLPVTVGVGAMDEVGVTDLLTLMFLVIVVLMVKSELYDFTEPSLLKLTGVWNDLLDDRNDLPIGVLKEPEAGEFTLI